MKITLGIFVFIALLTGFVFPLQAQEKSSASVKPALVLFRDGYYVGEDAKFKYDLMEYRDFLIQSTTNDAWNSAVAVVTKFDKNLLQSKLLRNVRTMEEAEAYIDSHMKLHPYKGLEIPELQFELADGKTMSRFWVGQKSYDSLEAAQKTLDGFSKDVEKAGINFDFFVTELRENGVPFEEPEELILTEEEGMGEGARNIEETVAMYVWEKADLGRFSGKEADEPWFLWQSVAETSWRSSNFTYSGYKSLVGYFANRVRVRGLAMPFGSSVDPYIEGILAFTSNGVDYNNTLDGRFGVEYRPFRGMKLFAKHWYTSWIQNLRGHIDYANRFATKDPILYSPDHDWAAGVDVFKEWGIDIPEEGKPDLFWGEYYGDYAFHRTNFSYIGYENKYNSFVANTRVLGGVKFPNIPLPDNPVNNYFTFMPYMGWEWINNNHLGGLFFENKYTVFAGVRWMPFRNKKFERHEWIYKMKLFFEYDGIGSVQYTKSSPAETEPSHKIRDDFRIGVNISSNRF